MLKDAISFRRAASAAIVVAAVAVGCNAPPAPSQPSPSVSPSLASASGAFETDGLLDGKDVVLAKPMIESDIAVMLRARQAGVKPSSLRASGYGIKFFVLHKDPEIGTAFMHRTQVYRIGLPKDQLIVDETYFYCTGFVSTDILRVTEKSWSKYYTASELDVARFDTLVEAVRNGSGQRDAFNALFSMGGLLKDAGPDQNVSEREVTWIAGRQAIEHVGIELTRSPDVGNRVSVRFLQ